MTAIRQGSSIVLKNQKVATGTTDDCCCITGACCTPNGECTEMTKKECLDAGGDYKGDNKKCTDPDTGQTACVGACCFEDECQDMTHTECESAGGNYQFGKHCGDPDFHCSERMGVCCYESSMPGYPYPCSTQESCSTYGGKWHDTACSNYPTAYTGHECVQCCGWKPPSNPEMWWIRFRANDETYSSVVSQAHEIYSCPGGDESCNMSYMYTYRTDDACSATTPYCTESFYNYHYERHCPYPYNSGTADGLGDWCSGVSWWVCDDTSGCHISTNWGDYAGTVCTGDGYCSYMDLEVHIVNGWDNRTALYTWSDVECGYPIATPISAYGYYMIAWSYSDQFECG